MNCTADLSKAPAPGALVSACPVARRASLWHTLVRWALCLVLSSAGCALAQGTAALDEAARSLVGELVQRPLPSATRLVVLPIEPTGPVGSTTAAALIYLQRQLIVTLALRPDIELLERTQIKTATEELRLQRSGAFDAASIAEIGRLVGANVALSGIATALDDGLAIQLTAVDVATGRVLATPGTTLRSTPASTPAPAGASPTLMPLAVQPAANPFPRQRVRMNYPHHSIRLAHLRREPNGRFVLTLVANNAGSHTSGHAFVMTEGQTHCTARVVLDDGRVLPCLRGTLPPVGTNGPLLQSGNDVVMHYEFEGQLPPGQGFTLEACHSLRPVSAGLSPAPLVAQLRLPGLKAL